MESDLKIQPTCARQEVAKGCVVMSHVIVNKIELLIRLLAQLT